MAKTAADINTSLVNIDLSKDRVIVRKISDSFSATLDVTGITEDVIPAGRVIVKKADGTFAPQTITSGAYVAPVDGVTYAGVLGGSILTKKPFASIVERGTVNVSAADLAPTAAAQAALKHILFTQDQ